MTGRYTRIKQPERVRRRLLDSAARLAAENGLAGVSLSAVAQAAGVTKGGLFHHFPSKQALIEGLFNDILGRLDEEIDRFIANDPVVYGCFTRAYVKSVFSGLQKDSPWGALSFSMITDIHHTLRWDNWLADRLERHKKTDNAPLLEVTRLAADGIWFTSLLSKRAVGEQFRHIEAQLFSLTRDPE